VEPLDNNTADGGSTVKVYRTTLLPLLLDYLFNPFRPAPIILPQALRAAEADGDNPFHVDLSPISDRPPALPAGRLQ
jgi:hypothetical protein